MSSIRVAAPEGRAVAEAVLPPIHLKIQNLTKRFGTFTALNRINLEIRKGEFVCFLGPSGCGKTTLLRVIAGLEAQNEGAIYLAGKDVSRADPADRDFGIVFQSYALFPNLTVERNVGYGLVNRGWSSARRQDRITELLDLVGLSDQGGKYPVQLSGGQQQRVALARALANSPRLLLLDEPLSALDAKVRVHLRSEIRSLQKRLGVTTVMVTHDQEEALAMADRIVVMNHGNIEQVGGPEAIYCRPETVFVSDFVGHTTFLDATVREQGRIQMGSLVLTVDHASSFAPGTAITLALRPEDVRTRGIDASTTNAFEVRVASLSFLGAFCRATLDPTGSADTLIAVDFSTNAMRDLGISVGQTRLVAFPPDCLRIYPRDAAR